MTKKLTTWSLFIFWAVVVAILTAGLVFYDRSKTTSTATTGGSTAITGIPAGQSVVLSSTEVAKHNSASNCWMIINGNVYDFTTYLNSHPGGVAVMTPYCGADGSSGFATKGIGISHSSFAQQLLANYLLGTVNQTVTSGQLNSATQSIQAQPTPIGGGRGFDN